MRGRCRHLHLPGPLAEWPIAKLGISRDLSLADSDHSVDCILGLPSSHCGTSSLRRGLVRGDCSLVELLKIFLLLGDSVSRWIESDNLAIKRSVSPASGDHTVVFVLGLPLDQAQEPKTS
jgi:hypothetical protein